MKTQVIQRAIGRIPHTIGLLVLAALFSACGGDAATEEGHEEEEEHKHEGGTSVSITPEQFVAIDGELGAVERKDLTTALKATGFLKVPPQHMADITATMGGTVREVFVHAEGAPVRKGQVLATITDPAIIDLQRNYVDAKARLVYAKAELDRQTELAGANVSAQKTLQLATADHAALQSSVMANAELLRLINIDPDRLNANELRPTANIVSPIDGTVAYIGVNVGSKVSGDAAMFRVVNNSKLHVDLLLYEQDIAKVKVGQKIDLSLTNLPGKNYTAVVFAIGSAFANETKTVSVHAEITGNKTGLIPGMGVTARIDLGQAKTNAVLTEAIVSHDGNDYIFIKTEGEVEHGNGEEAGQKQEVEHAHVEGEVHDHPEEKTDTHGEGEEHEHDLKHAEQAAEGGITFKRVQVKRGTTDGAYTAVTFLEEMPANAEVVVGGAYYLIAMMTNSGEHEH